MLDAYIKISFYLMLFGNTAGALVFLVLLLLQQRIFKSKLDPILFNERYFNIYELSVFTSFPLSLMKTLAYQRAIVFPSTMLKRFNDINVRSLVNKIDITISRISLGVLFFSAIILINLFIAGAANYYYFPAN